ncbi:right-handed parallel beta-helix repeat-containing protein [Candidatus Micrarchaeota archaeon]|nr:right-handed parallel beta-helix repeat-containing protein [Candidatus Micrarchaeota archaeon]
MKKIVFVLLLFSLIIGMEIEECVVIDEEGTYLLTDDLRRNLEDSCIRIIVDDVTIDCNGRKIIGDGKNIATGIEVLEDNIKIINCEINDFEKGIEVSGYNIEIDDVKINGCGYGIDLNQGAGAEIKNSETYGNEIGIYIDGKFGETISIHDNKVYKNTGTGIKSGAKETKIMDNEVYQNAIGIEIEGEGSEVDGNYINLNALEGIVLWTDATGSRVINNIIERNKNGLKFLSQNNIIENNKFKANGEYAVLANGGSASLKDNTVDEQTGYIKIMGIPLTITNLLMKTGNNELILSASLSIPMSSKGHYLNEESFTDGEGFFYFGPGFKFKSASIQAELPGCYNTLYYKEDGKTRVGILAGEETEAEFQCTDQTSLMTISGLTQGGYAWDYIEEEPKEIEEPQEPEEPIVENKTEQQEEPEQPEEDEEEQNYQDIVTNEVEGHKTACPVPIGALLMVLFAAFFKIQ